MKRRMFTKRFSKEKLAKFFDKEGFYVVVFLCVAIIATTAVYVTRNNMDYFGQEDGGEIAEYGEDHEYFQPEDITPMKEDNDQAVSADDNEEEEELEDSQEEVSAEVEREEQMQQL